MNLIFDVIAIFLFISRYFGSRTEKRLMWRERSISSSLTKATWSSTRRDWQTWATTPVARKMLPADDFPNRQPLQFSVRHIQFRYTIFIFLLAWITSVETKGYIYIFFPMLHVTQYHCYVAGDIVEEYTDLTLKMEHMYQFQWDEINRVNFQKIRVSTIDDVTWPSWDFHTNHYFQSEKQIFKCFPWLIVKSEFYLRNRYWTAAILGISRLNHFWVSMSVYIQQMLAFFSNHSAAYLQLFNFCSPLTSCSLAIKLPSTSELCTFDDKKARFPKHLGSAAYISRPRPFSPNIGWNRFT